jgi:uncharacterized membrane protein YfcA
VTVPEVLMLALSGFAAGIANAVAGGGTFFTFPVMVAYGMPTLNANATSAVALVPGSLATAAAYRHETATHWREVVPLALIGIAGGIVGGWLVIALGDEGFRPLVPWLLGTATLLFAFGAQIRRFVGRIAHAQGGASRAVAYAIMSCVAVYGGFFGAGMGIMLLATLTIVEHGDFHKANAMKNVIALLSQAVAVVLFFAGGLIWWTESLVVMLAAIAGGYLGVGLARRVPEPWVRGVVVVIGVALTVAFSLRA